MWYPAAQGGPLVDFTAGRQDRAKRKRQRVWLLNTMPDAFLGSAGIDRLLKEEPKPPGAAETAANPRLPLLAYGKITNLILPGRIKATPALAMAVSDSAHMLRIVSLEHRDRQWVEDGEVFLRLAGIDSYVEGHWCGEGTPIHQIKFIPYQTAHSTHRWLLVQTATGAVIFEPEIHRVPVSTGESCCSYVSQAPQCILMKSILSLDASYITGNGLADVAFRDGPGSGPPQLACIDTRGNWWIWEVLGNHHLRKKNLTPRLTKRGSFNPGPMDDLHLLDAMGEKQYRIWWLRQTGGGAAAYAANPDSSDSEAAPVERPVSSGGLHGAGRLLLCDGIHLRMLDVQSDEDLALSLVKQDGGDRVLDVQFSPTAPSQVFVLTSTTLFWLDIASLDLDSTRPPAGPSPAVLLSSPHLCQHGHQTMRLSVGMVAVGPAGNVQIVSIYSSQSTEMMVFWLMVASSGSTAKVHHQLLRSSVPAGVSGEVPRHRTVLLLPRDFGRNLDAAPQAVDQGLEYLKRSVRFFQTVALGTDLSLWSCLCAASSRQEAVAAPSLVRETNSRPTNRRQFLIRYYENSFVVPDTFDDRAFRPQPASLGKTAVPGQLARYRPKPRTLRLSLVVDLALGLVAKRLRGIEEGDMLGLQDDPLAEVQEAINAGFRQGQLPLQTLYVVLEATAAFPLLLTFFAVSVSRSASTVRSSAPASARTGSWLWRIFGVR